MEAKAMKSKIACD